MPELRNRVRITDWLKFIANHVRFCGNYPLPIPGHLSQLKNVNFIISDRPVSIGYSMVQDRFKLMININTGRIGIT